MAERNCKLEFTDSVLEKLVNHFDGTDISLIENAIIKTLVNYEVTERVTALVPYDDINERILKRYWACLLVDNKSKGTIYQYMRFCRKLEELIRKPFNQMDANDVIYFLAMEMERGVSDRSRENARAVLSAFFQWMTNYGIISANPIATLKSIKYHEEIKLPFNDLEIDALRGACKNYKERALIEFLIATGVRVSELSQMLVEDVNQTKMVVHVVHGKGSKERMTYITPLAMEHLRKYLESRKEHGNALFYNKNHEPLRAEGIRFILNEIAERANVKNVHPHRFRRTFASNLSRRGMEIQEIKKLMGHVNINTTMTYIYIDDSKVQASYNTYIA